MKNHDIIDDKYYKKSMFLPCCGTNFFNRMYDKCVKGIM